MHNVCTCILLLMLGAWARGLRYLLSVCVFMRPPSANAIKRLYSILNTAIGSEFAIQGASPT